jgi:hypothetical protein
MNASNGASLPEKRKDRNDVGTQTEGDDSARGKEQSDVGTQTDA